MLLLVFCCFSANYISYSELTNRWTDFVMFSEYAAMSLLKTLQPQMKNEYFTSETSDKKIGGDTYRLT